MTSEHAAAVAQLCATGDDERALALGEQLAAENPHDVALRLRLGFIYGAHERFDAAFAHMDAAADFSNGSDEAVLSKRAGLEAFSGRGDASASANAAIEIDPLQPQSIYYLAAHEWQGDYLLLDDARVLCSPIPKCASTSLKQLFAQLEPASGDERPHQRFGGPRIRQDRLRLQERDLEHHYRFAVVRDDLARFQSYYARNVVQAESLRREGHGLDTYLGLSTRPDLDELVSRLRHYQYVFLDVRHHTLPTRAYLHHDAGFYDDVFELTDIEELRVRLSEHTGTALDLAHKLRSGPTTEAGLSSSSRETLREYYGP